MESKRKKEQTSGKRRGKGECAERLTLLDLGIGERGWIEGVSLGVGVGRRLCELGFLRGEWVECVGVSPFGNPRAYMVEGGGVVALRNTDGGRISLSRDRGIIRN